MESVVAKEREEKKLEEMLRQKRERELGFVTVKTHWWRRSGNGRFASSANIVAEICFCAICAASNRQLGIRKT
jgi:hypothetical protein